MQVAGDLSHLCRFENFKNVRPRREEICCATTNSQCFGLSTEEHSHKRRFAYFLLPMSYYP